MLLSAGWRWWIILDISLNFGFFRATEVWWLSADLSVYNNLFNIFEPDGMMEETYWSNRKPGAIHYSWVVFVNWMRGPDWAENLKWNTPLWDPLPGWAVVWLDWHDTLRHLTSGPSPIQLPVIRLVLCFQLEHRNRLGRESEWDLTRSVSTQDSGRYLLLSWYDILIIL